MVIIVLDEVEFVIAVASRLAVPDVLIIVLDEDAIDGSTLLLMVALGDTNVLEGVCEPMIGSRFPVDV